MDERSNSSPPQAGPPALRRPAPPALPGDGRIEHPAPEHPAPEHAAPEHAVPEHAAPEHAAPEHAAPEFPAPGGSPVGGRSRAASPWRRIARGPRGAAGLGIGAAALLLWPFSGWSWWPWAAGVATLILLRLLRLDGLLRGWVWHVGGLVVVAGLMLSTSPWAWALAASIGVLLAGLVQLPMWRLAAVGAVLCLVAGAGFAVTQYRSAEEVAAQQAQTQRDSRGRLGAPRPTSVLPVLLNNIARGDAGAVCTTMLTEPIRATFAAAAGQPDCAAAVRGLAAQVGDPDAYAEADAPTTRRGDLHDVDACRLTWPDGQAAGPQLGHLTVGRAESGTTYVVTAFQPCASR